MLNLKPKQPYRLQTDADSALDNPVTLTFSLLTSG